MFAETFFAVKVVAISDTYLLHDEIEIPDGDILIHAGNFSPNYEYWVKGAYTDFIEWFRALPHKHKIFTLGRRDNNSFSSENIYNMLNKSTYFLFNNSILIDNVRISANYESSYNSYQVQVPINWAEVLEVQKEMVEFLKNSWGKELPHANILITNHAPWGILDSNDGCQLLAEKVKKSLSDFHVFSGSYKNHGMVKIEDTTYINPSICGVNKLLQYGAEEMTVKHKPIVFEINRP